MCVNLDQSTTNPLDAYYLDEKRKEPIINK